MTVPLRLCYTQRFFATVIVRYRSCSPSLPLNRNIHQKTPKNDSFWQWVFFFCSTFFLSKKKKSRNTKEKKVETSRLFPLTFFLINAILTTIDKTERILMV